MRAPAALWRLVATGQDLVGLGPSWVPRLEAVLAKLEKRELTGWSLELLGCAVATFAPRQPAALAWLACEAGQPIEAYVLAASLGTGLWSLGVGCWVHLGDALRDRPAAARAASTLGANADWRLRAALIGCVPTAEKVWSDQDDAALLVADPDELVDRSFGVLASLRGRDGFDLRDGVDGLRPEAIAQALGARRALAPLRLLKAFETLATLGAGGFRAIGEFADDPAAARVLVKAKPRVAVIEALRTLEQTQPLVRARLAAWSTPKKLGPLPVTLPARRGKSVLAGFIDLALTARPRKSGVALDDVGLRDWAMALQRAGGVYPSWLDVARDTCEPGSIDAWVNSLVLQWLAADCPPAHAWVLSAWCWLGYEASLGRWAAAGHEARALLACRAMTGSRFGLLALAELDSPQARTALTEAATVAQVGLEELLDQLVPHQKTDARWARAVERMTLAMIEGRRFVLSQLTEHLVLHPWAGGVLKNAVFGTRSLGPVVLIDGPRWVTVSGEPVMPSLDEPMWLAHVLELTAAEVKRARARKLTQSIDQLARSVEPVDATKLEGLTVTLEGVAALERRGWVRERDALVRTFAHRATRVTATVAYDLVADIEVDGESRVAREEALRELVEHLTHPPTNHSAPTYSSRPPPRS